MTDLLTSPTWRAGAANPIEGLRRQRLRWPNPTNAQALAVLSTVYGPVDTAADYKRFDFGPAGFPSRELAPWLAPDGVLPRMRLLSVGWVNASSKFKRPDDASWWGAAFKYPLWTPVATYLDLRVKLHDADPTFPPPPTWAVDEAYGKLAAGDSGELSHELVQVIAQDYADVVKSPAPLWLIPAKAGQQPPLSTEGQRRMADDKATDDADAAKKKKPDDPKSWTWLLVLVGIAYFASKRR